MTGRVSRFHLGSSIAARGESMWKAMPRRPRIFWQLARSPVVRYGCRVWGRDSIQGDVRFADALRQMGATVSVGENWFESRSSGPLQAIDADFNHIPDAAMTIAVAALYAQGTSTLRNIGSWRVKETDRWPPWRPNCASSGATIDEGADYSTHYTACADCACDHRHLRRPSDGHVLFPGVAGRSRAQRRPNSHQRPEMRRQDISGLFRSLLRNTYLTSGLTNHVA